MSDIVTGVLMMPDGLFWSDDPLSRAQHNSIRKEAADEIMTLRNQRNRLLMALSHMHYCAVCAEGSWRDCDEGGLEAAALLDELLSDEEG